MVRGPDEPLAAVRTKAAAAGPGWVRSDGGPSAPEGQGAWTESAAVGRGAPPGTLEEVFLQAAAAAPLLSAKAAALARRGGGMVWSTPAGPEPAAPPAGPDRVGPGWIAEANAAKDVGQGNQTSLKPWGRAVEKVVRCYGGDPTRLLDCCRCRVLRVQSQTRAPCRGAALRGRPAPLSSSRRRQCKFLKTRIEHNIKQQC